MAQRQETSGISHSHTSTFPPQVKKEWVDHLLKTQNVPEFSGSLPHYFHKQAKKRLNKPFCVFHDEHDLATSLTYKQLDEQSSRLANFLKKMVSVEEKVIGIAVERSLNTFIAFMAAFKAGLAAVPLETSLEKNSKENVFREHKIKSTNIKHVLVNEKTASLFDDPITTIKMDDPRIAEKSSHCRAAYLPPDTNAYILFTSGSTGTPKGVKIKHKALDNLCQGFPSLDPIHHAKILCTADDRFDAFIWDLIYATITGGTVHFTCAKNRFNTPELERIIEKEKINVMISMPEIFKAMDKKILEKLKEVTSMGAKPDVETLTFLHEHGIKVYNGFGVTETGIGLSLNEFSPDKPIDIISGSKGFIPNMMLFLANDDRICELDRLGEIYVAGPQLGKYLDSELHKEKFPEIYINLETLKIESPETTTDLTSPHILRLPVYKTGDQASYSLTEENELRVHYKGRINNQVKIHGVGVNLDTVQSIIKQHPEVEDIVVLHHIKNGSSILVAHIIPKAGHQISRKVLWDHIRKTEPTLPPVSYPREIRLLNQPFPLTTNGKINTKALMENTAFTKPAPTISRPPVSVSSHKLRFRTQIIEILAENLNLDKDEIDPDDKNFTYEELGGDSIHMMNLIDKIRALPHMENIGLQVNIFNKDMTIHSLITDLGTHRKKTSSSTAIIKIPHGRLFSHLKGPGPKLGPGVGSGPAPTEPSATVPLQFELVAKYCGK